MTYVLVQSSALYSVNVSIIIIMRTMYTQVALVTKYLQCIVLKNLLLLAQYISIYTKTGVTVHNK